MYTKLVCDASLLLCCVSFIFLTFSLLRNTADNEWPKGAKIISVIWTDHFSRRNFPYPAPPSRCRPIFGEKRITKLAQIFGCNFLTYLKCEMGYYWLADSSGGGSNCYQLLCGCLWLFCGFRRCWSTSKCVSIAVGWLAERILTRPGAGRAKHSCQYWCFRDPLSYTYFWRFCVRGLHVASVDH